MSYKLNLLMVLLDGQSACLSRPESKQDTDSQLGLNVDLLHINFFFHRMDGRMVAKMHYKHEAAMKRERALAYAFSHQVGVGAQ
jgi:hypothetical protein